jgi:hypothetical protein
MKKYLHITYCDPRTLTNDLVVSYQLKDHEFAQLWANTLLEAQQLYHIDDPERFYGFRSFEEEQKYAVKKINQCIDSINSHRRIIERKVTSVFDQDTLNYLHHIFEVYHGLLDQQTHEFYISANSIVKKSLADLNILVHRCESVMAGSKPRHVVTYFGMPKTKTLDRKHYDYFTDVTEFGNVYLNYVEIGKTLEDLAVDQDQYIGEQAFKPYNFYSADFSVRFYNSNSLDVENKRTKIKEYFFKNEDFFKKLKLDFDHYSLRPGHIPLATLCSHGTEVIPLLSVRCYAKSVILE